MAIVLSRILLEGKQIFMITIKIILTDSIADTRILPLRGKVSLREIAFTQLASDVQENLYK